jgi:hypothetical protein
MARMFPQWLPASGKSNAERKLFAVLRDYLPDEYTVIWSIDWTMGRPASHGGGARESEVDFLVLHPEKGLLILEVKGGGVGYDGTRHEWHTIDATSTRRPIHDPFDQARDGKYALLRELTQQVPQLWLRTACRNSVFGHAVIVPDIAKDRLTNRPTRPDNLVLDRQDLQPATILSAIEHTYAFWTRSTSQPLGQRAVDEIVTLYAPSWYVRPLLADVFEEEHTQLKQLTEQQFTILDLLRWQKRVAVSGCAGCGKTFLAIEQAKRLARRGLDVLLTCYNRNLANWLRRHLTEQARKDLALRHIEVMNFHRVAYRLCEQAHIALPQDESRAFDEDFARGLTEASAKVEQRYDAILADEGQDFSDSWWDALLCLLRSPQDGYFYVFYDDNQRIYGRHSIYPVPADHSYPLTINCRTTLKIHEEVMKHYHSDDLPVCKGPAGRDVERITVVPTKNQEVKTLEKLLDRLIQEERIAIENIVLLSPASKTSSRFREGTRLGKRYRLSWEMERPFIPNTLMCCSIFAFKGLERDVVILAEPDKIQGYTEREQLVYVALSRARFHLILLGNLLP